MSTETGRRPGRRSPIISWTPANVRHALNGPTMGTRYSAVFLAPADLDSRSPARPAIRRRCGRPADVKLATGLRYVSRFNMAAIGTWVAVAPDLLEVVETGLEIGRRSNGAFDIGLGKLVNAWGFGPEPFGARCRGHCEVCRMAGSAAPATLLELDRRNNRMRACAHAARLCGIAKGFGVDQLARRLEPPASPDYLVSIDGELRARGCRLDGALGGGHRAARQDGRAIRQPSACKIVAIATSGDYRHGFEHAGATRLAHDGPAHRTAARQHLAAVSVLAANAMLADAWATALLVAGEEADRPGRGQWARCLVHPASRRRAARTADRQVQ